MNLLPIGDGRRYIDLSKAKEFDLGEVKYYKSERGVWVCKEAKFFSGQAVTEREAFKAFMSAGRFAEAKEHFEKLYKHGSKVPGAKTRARWRFTFGGLIGLGLIAYIAFSVAGKIPASHQVTIAELAVIVIGVMAIVILIQPGMLSEIQEFGLGGLVSVRMKNKLQDLEETQEKQTKQLDDLRFTTNLLVTDLGREQLEHLVTGSTANYQRNEQLQDELRRLRGLGLIKSKDNIRNMPEDFDLSEWVELTDRGREYLRRWNEVNP